jgi:hypothetical protein
MIKLMMERKIPPGLDMSDPGTLARHARIALDAHRAAGTHWITTYIAGDRFFGVIAVEDEAQARAYAAAAGISDQAIVMHRIVRQIDPSDAGAAS